VDTFSLTNGIQTINFEDGDSNVWVRYGTPETFFVVIESRDELDETNPTQFRIGHLSDAGTRAEDSETDIEIALVAIDDTYSDIVTLTEFEETISSSALFMDAYKHQIADASQSYGMDAADIDKDGDMDVVISLYDLNKVLWYENDGFQTFTEHTLLENFSYPSSVYAIDLNQDSYTDFIALSLDGELSWLKNDGTENFTEFFISELTNRPFEIYPSDMDGDNDIDIVLIRLFTYDNIFWYENDGNGNFTEYSLNENFFKGHSIHAADIDGDGDNDIVATSDKEVAWFENEGFNSFTKHTLFESTGYDDDELYAVYTADLDGDEDIDILYGNDRDNDVIWLENDGSENFTEHIIDSNIETPRDIYTSDMDNDGDLDILAADYSGSISWYENDGSENFTEYSLDITGARCVVAADVDNDNDLDLLATGTESAVWFENKGGQFVLTGINTAPGTIYTDEISDVLQITLTHNGTSDEPDLELTSLELIFEESDDDPLTTDEANNMFKYLYIYLDDGSGAFESDADALVHRVDTFSLTSGVQAIYFSDGDSNVRVSSGTPKTYFVVLETVETFDASYPSQFRVGHLSDSGTSAEDWENDLELTREYSEEIFTGTIELKKDYALEFDGSGDYVSISYDEALNPDTFTFEAWAYVSGGSGTWRNVMTNREGSYRGPIIYAGTNDKWQIWLGDESSWKKVTGDSVVMNTWTHLAGTYDGSKLYFYINGELQGTTSVTQSKNTSGNFVIGGGYSFDGMLDEFRVWNIVRSQSEIQENMEKTLAGDEDGLVAYYPFDEGSGTIIEDVTGSGYDGSKVGNVQWVDRDETTLEGTLTVNIELSDDSDPRYRFF
jgi:hypothetical protein